jgi:hypothetical protein
LLLEDAKTILGQLQNAILLNQIEELSESSRICPDCDGVRAVHDYRSRVLDTLFGRFQVKAPRIRRCTCTAKSDVVLCGPLSPLSHFFPDRSTPELRRLQAELGARNSFWEAARILETFLPCAEQVNTSVRNRLGKVAWDICDSELIESGHSPTTVSCRSDRKQSDRDATEQIQHHGRGGHMRNCRSYPGRSNKQHLISAAS